MRPANPHAIGSAEAMAVLLAGLVAARVAAPRAWRSPLLQQWSTIFGAVCLQALPYVVLGVLVAAGVGAVPARWLQRALPRRPLAAVAVGALGGAALPGCECGSVPVAAGLLRRGVAPGPAMAVMLSAPATNPVVLAATAAAFPGHPAVVAARAVASLAVALVVGAWWQLRGLPAAPRAPEHVPHGHGSGRLPTELGRSLGLLTIGAAAVAALHVLAPGLPALHGASSPVPAALVLAGLAVLLAVCSEADAVVAASFVGFPATARLAFMVVGPAVDVKLLALQAGTFGPRFAVRLATIAFAVALVCSLAVGGVLL